MVLLLFWFLWSNYICLKKGSGWLGWGASQVMLVVKNPAVNAGDTRVLGFPEGGHGNLLQYSCLENPMDRGAWWAIVHGVTKSQTWLTWFSMHAQERVLSGQDGLRYRLPPGLSCTCWFWWMLHSTKASGLDDWGREGLLASNSGISLVLQPLRSSPPGPLLATPVRKEVRMGAPFSWKPWPSNPSLRGGWWRIAPLAPEGSQLRIKPRSLAMVSRVLRTAAPANLTSFTAVAYSRAAQLASLSAVDPGWI